MSLNNNRCTTTYVGFYPIVLLENKSLRVIMLDCLRNVRA